MHTATVPASRHVNSIAHLSKLPLLARLGDATDLPSTLEPAPTPSACIMLGIDHRGRPHASRFEGVELQAVAAAADDMAFTTLPVTSAALADLAKKLPVGRLFRSGKAFVPFVGLPVFERLVAYLPIAARPLKPASPNRVSASAATDQDKGDKGKPVAPDAPKPNTYSDVKAGTAKPRPDTFPDGWDKIRVGHIVLATAERDEGWWTAHVREDKGDGLYLLEWEEWEGFDQFLRRREQIALLHPGYDGK